MRHVWHWPGFMALEHPCPLAEAWDALPDVNSSPEVVLTGVQRCQIDQQGTRPPCTGHVEVVPLVTEPSVAVTIQPRAAASA